MRSFQTPLLLLVRLAVSFCAVAFVLSNVQEFYAPLTSFSTTRPPAPASPGGAGGVLGSAGGVDLDAFVGDAVLRIRGLTEILGTPGE